jgi:predicted nucleic acid-binding Zn ribbon protein
MGLMASEEQGGVILTAEEKRRRRTRSIAIAFALGALVVLFYLVTILRLGGNVFNRPI